MIRAATGFVLAAYCVLALAQYPEKPVRFVVPFAPGGATDLLARTLGERLSAGLGQPFVVENKPGAATQVAAQYVAKAPADGYTLLMATSTTLAINKSLYRSLAYDPEKESMTGVEAIHVPYKGGAPALIDIMGGQVAMMFDNTAHTYISSGKLRALAVTTRDRLSVLPDVPTLHEAGVAGYDLAAWQGVVATAGTPRPVVDRLNGEIRKLLQLPDVRQRLTADGGQIITSTPDEFAAHISREVVRFAKIVKDSGAKVE
jgi:tripartite-type tricarboxylate transporter receptor subunit TctC